MMMEFAELVTKIPPAGHSLCEIVDSTMRLIQPYAIRIATFSALSASILEIFDRAIAGAWKQSDRRKSPSVQA